jgi:hypothetical protein
MTHIVGNRIHKADKNVNKLQPVPLDRVLPIKRLNASYSVSYSPLSLTNFSLILEHIQMFVI